LVLRQTVSRTVLLGIGLPFGAHDRGATSFVREFDPIVVSRFCEKYIVECRAEDIVDCGPEHIVDGTIPAGC
jgi:hypothetical protein